jgi:hypothetical protein
VVNAVTSGTDTEWQPLTTAPVYWGYLSLRWKSRKKEMGNTGSLHSLNQACYCQIVWLYSVLWMTKLRLREQSVAICFNPLKTKLICFI